MDPLVSIGMSVYNNEKTISASIRSLLHQTYPHWELILLDDASKDETLTIVKRFDDPRIKCFSDGHRLGLPVRLNQAVAHSRGKYFARIDGDDIAYPERLEKQVAFLECHPEIDLLGTRILAFEDDGNVIGAYPFRSTHAEICRNPSTGFYLYHPTWMGKKQWFEKHPYLPEFVKTQDQELLLRTHTNSLFASLPEFLNGYRKPSLSLKTILISRLYFSKALFQSAVRLKNVFLIAGIPVLAAKCLVDAFAIITGFNYKILRHRALPVPSSEVERWRRVWTAVN